jgi:hypothetical protein
MEEDEDLEEGEIQERWESPESPLFERTDQQEGQVPPKMAWKTQQQVQKSRTQLIKDCHEELKIYNRYPNIRFEIFGATPTIRNNFKRDTLYKRRRHYRYIRNKISEIYPLETGTLSYKVAFMEFNLWKGRCVHGTNYYRAEAYCSACDAHAAKLEETYQADKGRIKALNALEGKRWDL